jgi:hypothetical protein
MKDLLRMPVSLFSRKRPRSNEEQHLAPTVDAQDLDFRLPALEGARP